MAAPQARAMAGVIEPLMSGEGANWLLYGIGGVIALVLNACGISALAFALGMFIPLQLNLPLLVGGLVSHFVMKSSKQESVIRLRQERGTLLASGLIAGGALMGVVSAALKFAGIDLELTTWLHTLGAQWVSLVAYALIMRLYDEYAHDIRLHMKYEEKTLFPYVEALLEGQPTTDYNADIFARHHDDKAGKFHELKSIIIKYLPQSGLANNQLTATLYDIYINEEWLANHSRVEEQLPVNTTTADIKAMTP